MDKTFVSKFLKGSFSTSFGTLSTLALHFLSISIMSRYVPKEVLGLYFLIVAIATFGKILSSLGMDLTLVQILASEEEETQQQSFFAIVCLRIITVLSLSLLLYFAGSFILSQFDTQLLEYRWHLVFLFALMSFRELFFYILQGLQLFKPYAILQALSAIIRFALVVILRDSLNLTNLLLIDFASLGITFLMQFWFLPLKRLVPERWIINGELLPKFFHYGLPLYTNSLLSHVSDFGGTYIVGIFLSPVSIAAYEIAKKIPDGFRRLFNSFHTVYFPNLSSLFAKKDFKNAEKFLNSCLSFLAVGSFALTLFSLVFSRELILLLASETYLEVQPTFILIMFAVCLQLLSTTMGYSLVSAGYPGFSTRVNIVAMGLEFGGSLLLVPIMGYLGIGVTYVMMSLIGTIACYFFLRKANVLVDLSMLIRPFLVLALCSLLYLLVGDAGIAFKFLILLAYALLSLWFIPATRQAVAYFWSFAQAKTFHTKSV